MFLVGTEHATLDSKNVLALRALFGLAHRLSALLGESWLLVLATVNCLDCILNTPRQSAQVHVFCSALRIFIVVIMVNFLAETHANVYWLNPVADSMACLHRCSVCSKDTKG